MPHAPRSLASKPRLRQRQLRFKASLPSALAALALIVVAAPALAVDRGQFDDVPDDVRAWFKSRRSPAGVPCCDVADGHRTAYDVRDGHYWVPIEGVWTQVPDKAVIREGGNPVGEAVVWYLRYRGEVIISCFVPADAV